MNLRITLLAASWILCLFAPARAQDLVPDPAFATPALEMAPNNASPLEISLAAHPDGGVLVATYGAVLTGRNVPPLVKLKTDGSIDPAFVAPVFARQPKIVYVYADGCVLVHDGRDRLLRLLAGGAVDPAFAAIATESVGGVRSLALRDGRLLLSGFNRIEGLDTRLAMLDTNGRLDRSFSSSAYSVDMAQQADGRLVMAGQVLWPDGRAYRYLFRLNLDGSIDTSFDPGTAIAAELVVPLPDGRILAGTRLKLFRLLANGTVDPTYQPELAAFPNSLEPRLARIDASGVVYFIAYELETPGGNRLVTAFKRLDPDGRADPTFSLRSPTFQILDTLGGDRSPRPVSWDGRTIYLHNPASSERSGLRQYATRVNANGTIDAAFSPRFSMRALLLSPLVRAPDGKYVIYGAFDYVEGAAAAEREGNCVRLNADGSLDRSFQAPLSVRQGSNIYGLRPYGVQPDGRVLVTADNVVWRLGLDGIRDLTFPAAPLRTLAVAGDGSFVGIEFGTGRVSRYRADGTRDTAFNTTVTPSHFLAATAGGKTLVEQLDDDQVIRLTPDGSRDTTYTPLALPFLLSSRVMYALLANGGVVACRPISVPSAPGGRLQRMVVFDANGRQTRALDLRSDLHTVGAALQQVVAANGGGSVGLELFGASGGELDFIHVMGDEVTLMPAMTNVDYRQLAPLARFRPGPANAGRWAPEIVVQPVSRTVARGGSTSLTVQVLGELDFTYQWFKDGAPFRAPQTTGGTGSVILTNVQPTDAGDYFVEVRNTAGTVRSAVMRLEVSLPPVLLQEPPAVITIAEGQPLALTLNASGGGLRYVWRNGIGFAVADSGTSTTAAGGMYTAYFTGLRAGDSGSYRADITNASGTVRSRAVIVNVVANARPGRLDNVSVRTQAGSGDDSLILGFVVAGAASETIPVLIRGAGPALGGFGLTNFLADPRLSFRSATVVLAENDDWGGDAGVTAMAASVGAFPFSDVRSRDAALYRPAVAAGGYTVQISGAGGETGTALAEIYATAGAARIVNLSSRARVRADDPLIAGFVIAGETAQTLLLRGVGPGLAAFGVQGALAKAQ
ncbi:MAG: immunoglobulin domain-containing protein [Verrucomicrobia bacterium]|nr:immunoglobulin domain-containing protein [Verrucomicrobiota bacterium]